MKLVKDQEFIKDDEHLCAVKLRRRALTWHVIKHDDSIGMKCQLMYSTDRLAWPAIGTSLERREIICNLSIISTF